MFLDRGLQSPALAEVLATIANCAGYVEDIPFPIVVNAVLLRLAEAFQGEKFNPKVEQFLNVIRLNIVKAVHEFRQHLHVAFSCDEIVRCIMKVSHSNDFHARSLTLLFLAALAPLISENKKAHHLLIESLDCSEEAELYAGIYAITEFGKYSSAFGALVVEKITEILCSSQNSLEVKLQLLNVVSNFKESNNVIKTCFQLANRLLKSNYNRLLQVAVYNSSTTLASRCSSAISGQIALLLNELEKSNSVFITHCLLANLTCLAKFPEKWRDFQVTRIRDLFERIQEMQSCRLLCAWLKCMEVLTSTKIHCDTVIEKNFSWITLLKSDNLVLRISGIQLIINIMECSAVNYLQGIFLSVVSQTISDIHQLANITLKDQQNEIESGELKFKDSVELNKYKRLFYKSVSVFTKMALCSSRDALSLVHNLMKNLSLLSALGLNKKQHQQHLNITDEAEQRIKTYDLALQTLCAICDTYPDCAIVVSKWGLNELFSIVHVLKSDEDAEKNIQVWLTQIPFSLYNLIMIARCEYYETKTQSIDGKLIMDIGEPLDFSNNFGVFLNCIDQIISLKTKITSNNVEKFTNENIGWILYKIARCALRFGHWRKVALPLLEKVSELCESLETSSWINGLINIAKSQINDSKELSVNQLNKSYKYLRNAHLIFQRLAATPQQELCFNFGAVYTHCLALSWKAICLALSTLNVKILTLTQFQQTFMEIDLTTQTLQPYCIEQICDSLTMVRKSVENACQEWTALYQRSFDADAHTLEQIELWIHFTFIIDNILRFLCAQPLRFLNF